MLKYKADLKGTARFLRKHLTDSEEALWSRLRRKQLLGVQFYRQKPVGAYIVDFFAPSAKLVVEVDGSQHLEAEHAKSDRLRDAHLASLGLTVLRFNSREVLGDMDAVVEAIDRTILEQMNVKIPPDPSLIKGGIGEKGPDIHRYTPLRGRSATMDRPILGITMGDPASIGPEIAAKALAEVSVYGQARPFILGDTNVMADTLRITGLPLRLNVISAVDKARFVHGTLDVWDFANVDMTTHQYGKVSAMCGKASVEYIEKGIAMAMAKEIDAVVTGPIHKESINQAGCPHPGHTEIFGTLTGTKDYAMMLVGGDLRVVHVSTHVSLRTAIERTKKPRILTVIRLANRALKALGIAQPKIAVAGLNPHAGEHGLFGDEEIKEIIPAIEEARAEGMVVEGPIAPDTVFGRTRGGLYDIVVCMYHDQGHIPLKTLGFTFDKATQKWTSVAGVNVTLGLPIIRTSVDHGTAFGKAGKGTAAHDSMLDAIDVAVKLAHGRKAGLLA